jgi:chromate transport protein ChrA
MAGAWRGAIVLVLAVTVSVCVVAVVLVVLSGEFDLDAAVVAWVGTVLGALVGIVGAYVVGGIGRGRPGR